jgi:hypothetical protein
LRSSFALHRNCFSYVCRGVTPRRKRGSNQAQACCQTHARLVRATPLPEDRSHPRIEYEERGRIWFPALPGYSLTLIAAMPGLRLACAGPKPGTSLRQE